ncbi:MAG TPA: pitrilysin family protein [Vicinamibacterales bacterium]|nr:pitrilysin family protein [Vicinamibacterales bacterium]
MRVRQFALLVFVAAVGAVGLIQGAERQARPPATSAAIPRLDHQTYTLKNGLKVILSEDKRLPMVAVNLWYHVGPANEIPGRTGFAHLFEHMMFQGSKHVAADTHFKLLEAAGASDINGTTDFDRTNYFETVPSNELELALWIESDRMGYLLDVLDGKALANQRDVVRNERRQSLENQPYGVAEEALYQALYPAGHPYHGVVIGSHADLAASELNDVQQFFKEYYTPNNASLAIVGDFDPAAARRLVEKYFGALKRGPEVPKITAQTPPITSEKRLTVTDTVQLPRVYMAWLTPAIFKPGDADADLAANILGGGKSSRLYKALVYDKQIAQSVQATQESLILGSKFTIQATARPGHTAQELEDVINLEVTRLMQEIPATAEFERAQTTIESRIILGLETLGGFGGKADRLNSYEHYLHTPDYLAQDLQRYRDATPQTVKTFAETYLGRNKRVVLHAIPGEKKLLADPAASKSDQAAGAAQSVNADEAWRAAKPRSGPLKAAQFATPQQFTLPNGLTVIFSERRELPVVSATLVFGSGSGTNPPDQPGLANFAVAMLDEGTATRNALQIAEEAARLGATLTTSSAMDASQVAVTSLSRQFPSALALMSDVVLHPTFPSEEVERQRASRLANLVSQKSNPAQIAQRVMAAAVFGPNHPYGYIEIGTEASNKALTRDAMVGFWKQQLVPGNAALVVVGAISRSELEKLASPAFAGWSGQVPGRTSMPAPRPTDAKLIIVDTPGAAQTQLRIAGVGARRTTPDYEATEVMNMVLGGLFTSRINLNLREDKGYTYGAFSTFAFRKEPGPFYVGSGVRTDATAPSVSEILTEIRKMRDVQVTVDELSLGRDSLVRSLPGRFETSEQAAGSLSSLYVYQLGLDYYAQYVERLLGVDAASVQAAARKYLLPDQLLVVAVGDRQKIESDLKNLQLGTIEYRDAEGVVLPQK